MISSRDLASQIYGNGPDAVAARDWLRGTLDIRDPFFRKTAPGDSNGDLNVWASGILAMNGDLPWISIGRLPGTGKPQGSWNHPPHKVARDLWLSFWRKDARVARKCIDWLSDWCWRNTEQLHGYEFMSRAYEEVRDKAVCMALLALRHGWVRSQPRAQELRGLLRAYLRRSAFEHLLCAVPVVKESMRGKPHGARSDFSDLRLTLAHGGERSPEINLVRDDKEPIVAMMAGIPFTTYPCGEAVAVVHRYLSTCEPFDLPNSNPWVHTFAELRERYRLPVPSAISVLWKVRFKEPDGTVSLVAGLEDTHHKSTSPTVAMAVSGSGRQTAIVGFGRRGSHRKGIKRFRSRVEIEPGIIRVAVEVASGGEWKAYTPPRSGPWTSDSGVLELRGRVLDSEGLEGAPTAPAPPARPLAPLPEPRRRPEPPRDPGGAPTLRQLLGRDLETVLKQRRNRVDLIRWVHQHFRGDSHGQERRDLGNDVLKVIEDRWPLEAMVDWSRSHFHRPADGSDLEG